MKKIFFYFLIFVFQNNFGQIKIFKCDSIYRQKGYKISLKNIADANDEDESKNNIIFTFYKIQKNQRKIIYQEPLFSKFKNLIFEDFNGDGIKDILVENISDVRSNLTHYLFLVDFKKGKLIKIIGFDKIKNPIYIKKYNIVSNLVMSGRNWTGFYKISNNKIKDFGYTFYWQDENGNEVEDIEYDKILKRIINSEKKKNK